LTLDRTPFTTWGGYGGMSFRGSREMHNVSFALPDGSTAPNRRGEPGEWVVMQGQMDDGVDQKVSLGMIDHPSNPRSPSPWYGHSEKVNFINAAFLFHEKLEVIKGRPLIFRYRMYYRDGVWEAGEFAKLADDFRSQKVTR
jgi:Family of unknown function (DUF6807)